MMLGRWDATKGLALQYQAPLKDFVLSQVAYEIHRRGQTSVSTSEFRHLVEHELKIRGHTADVEILTEEMLNRSGLFRIVGDTVEFRHLMLQEFFAGRGIPSPESVESLVSNDWWRRALVFYFGENPGDGKTLDYVMSRVSTRPGPEVYQAAVTLGLAIQASYLVQVTRKMPMVKWLIESLAAVQADYEKFVEHEAKYPLNRFLSYYIFARESVAISTLEQCCDEIIQSLDERDLTAAEKDKRLFWIITGLIEAGALSKAEEIVKDYSPADNRLAFGIHLGAFLLHHQKVTTQAEHDAAERIGAMVGKNLAPLKQQLLAEFKSELLELRGNRIEALPLPDAGKRTALAP
jgi:hypothetical protein